MNLADCLRAALARETREPPIEGDEYDRAGGVYAPAAVLVAVTDRPEPGMLLTLRQPHLKRHAGQIAFPGGRVDPDDKDAIAAALREAQEEIGLDPHAVDIVGTSDTYRVGTGFAVTPVIGVIPPDLALAPQEAEVAALFETPLAFLLEPGNHMLKSMMWEGRERRFHEILWEDRRIWGATANMIVNLARRLAASGMILPDIDWRQRPELARLSEALGADSGLVRYVGGAVRDTLLGLPVSDLDLATSLLPEEVARRVRAAGFKAVPTGIAHGTVTAILPDGPVEVTTLRRDVETDGRRATVAFTDDWREDAARRDFTINALSADPVSGLIHDYFDGIADIEARLARFIGDPLKRIAEDHLRILRFFRFHARFGRGDPDPAGLAACAVRANDLMALSRERIAQELLKLLAVADPTPTVALMVERGIFAPVLPEIEANGVARLARLVERERAYEGDPVRRLAALLPADPDLADQVGKRLKLSNAQSKRLVLAAAAGEPGPARPLAHKIGPQAARDRLLLRSADPAASLAEIESWTPPRLPIGGGDLVALGLSAGPVVAATLQAIEQMWVAEGFPGPDRVRAIARAAVDQALRAR